MARQVTELELRDHRAGDATGGMPEGGGGMAEQALLYCGPQS